MRKRRSFTPVSVSQVLEDRALLAANLTDGVLTIEGSNEEGDVIKLRLETPEVDEEEPEAEPSPDLIILMG